jgi:hemoglobin
MNTAVEPTTPYEILGGAAPVRQIVDRFYDLMDADPAYAALRALHAPDLAPMRASLAGFLDGWLGGPRDWFASGRCVMSAHSNVKIDRATSAQWTEAMARAIADAGVAPELAEKINAAFANMAGGMARGRE